MEKQRGFKEIVFLDTPANAERYVRSAGSSSLLRDRLHIAMTPTIYEYLVRNGFTTHDTLPYFTNSSHITALERSAVMLDWLRERLDVSLDDLGVKRAYIDTLTYQMRCSINYCLWALEVVSNAIDAHRPEKIIIFKGLKRPTVSIYTEPEEGVLEELVAGAAVNKNIPVTTLGYPDIINALIRPIENVKIYCMEWAKFIARHIKFGSWERRLAASFAPGRTGPVLLTTPFYGMNELGEMLRKNVASHSFYRLEDAIIARMRIPDILIDILCGQNGPVVKKHKRLLRDLAGTLKAENGVFSYRNVALARPMAAKFRDSLSVYCIGLVLWTFRLNAALDRLKPSAVISNGNRVDDLALAELCARKNIKDIFISHGSHRAPQGHHETIEWGEHGRALMRGPFSHLALQTPLAEGYLASFPSSAVVVKTGPLIWGRPIDAGKSKALREKLGIRDGMKVILHAGTPKPTSALRFNVYETSDEYIQALRDAARAVSGLPDTVLVIRCRPSRQISMGALKKLVPFGNNVLLNTEGSFPDALGMADLVMSFSSTTIEEALQNRIPVVLYGGGGRYKHVQSPGVAPHTRVEPSAVYHVTKAEDLEYALGQILSLPKGDLTAEKIFEPYVYDNKVRVPLAQLL